MGKSRSYTPVWIFEIAEDEQFLAAGYQTDDEPTALRWAHEEYGYDIISGRRLDLTVWEHHALITLNSSSTEIYKAVLGVYFRKGVESETIRD